MIKIPDSDDDLLKECEVQVYRSSGKGGQHVNTTDSAVRVKHLPSGIVTTCQESRSQHVNKGICLNKIRAAVAEKNKVKKRRIPTKKKYSSKVKTLKKKKIRSDVKKNRQKPDY